MSVVTADSRGMVITSITKTNRLDATYNITVADFETYFVGKQKVLVHNCRIKMKDKGSARRTDGSKEDLRSAVAQADSAEDLKCAQCKLKESIKNRRAQNKKGDRNSPDFKKHNNRIKFEERELQKVERKLKDN
ncbi:hypothetical protein JYT75_00465 [Oceanicaulis sp. AH-315-P02]|nr:hypothetical protein [Robiginitomaculum sp.]MBN4047771.1 hypothetical protein [Oceanicaulis sp. AH-315-P02]